MKFKIELDFDMDETEDDVESWKAAVVRCIEEGAESWNADAKIINIEVIE